MRGMHACMRAYSRRSRETRGRQDGHLAGALLLQRQHGAERCADGGLAVRVAMHQLQQQPHARLTVIRQQLLQALLLLLLLCVRGLLLRLLVLCVLGLWALPLLLR